MGLLEFQFQAARLLFFVHHLVLVKSESSFDRLGRATYHVPLRLWDKATGNLTDFTTNFTFVHHLHLVMPFILFLILIPSVAPLSFNFTTFNPNDKNISYQGDSSPNGNTIELTNSKKSESSADSLGRATYYVPLRLWDKATGNLTDFTTHFTFVIESENGNTNYGDGLAFMLAENYTLPKAGGGAFGLASHEEHLNATNNPFLAVEFDTFSNPGVDPSGSHVGIDINSINSSKTVPWSNTSSIVEGRLNEAWISYNSTLKKLSVDFTDFKDNRTVLKNLDFDVDLRDILSQTVFFGFSAATGALFESHSIYSWSFSSSLEINETVASPPVPDRPSPPVPDRPSPPVPDGPSPDSNKTGLAVGLGISGGCVLLVGVCFIWFCLRKNGQTGENEDDPIFNEYMNDGLESGTGPRRFSYNELARATNNFAGEEKLGEGGFGGVYRGCLQDMDLYVAVKRISSGSKQGLKEYASEVKTISRLRHRNLVQLIGWCRERKELLIVYEYMPNKSLDFHLFSQGSHLLAWEERYRIAIGLASALFYLQEECDQCVLHRDIKSSNVLLDSNFNAKLGDFGLARLVDHGQESQTTNLIGTMGYMAPEYLESGKAIKESDVYSFGIVALEIACGRRAIETIVENGNNFQVKLVKWVWAKYGQGDILQAADPRLCGNYNEDEMESLMVVGLSCAHPDRNNRPPIRQVLDMLNLKAPLLVLPPEMPVSRYVAPQLNMTSVSVSSSSHGGTSSQISSQNHYSTSMHNPGSSKLTTSSTVSSDLDC